MGSYHISPEKRAAIEKDRADDMSVREVAAKHGVSERSVRRCAPGDRVPLLDHDQKTASLRAHEAGETVEVIANRYGVSKRTMERALRKAKASGMPTPKDSKPTSIHIDGACNRELPELFEYDPEEWPNKSEEQWRQDLAYALDVCIECPVMTLCGEQATKGERFWTVRGGREPHRWLADHPPIGVLH